MLRAKLRKGVVSGRGGAVTSAERPAFELGTRVIYFNNRRGSMTPYTLMPGVVIAATKKVVRIKLDKGGEVRVFAYNVEREDEQ